MKLCVCDGEWETVREGGWKKQLRVYPNGRQEAVEVRVPGVWVRCRQCNGSRWRRVLNWLFQK